jgi:hypothetical protein
VKRWWSKYQQEDPNEVFDRFIAIWLILAALARTDENENTGKRDVPESDMVESFFSRQSGTVAEVLEQFPDPLKNLAQRVGDTYGNPILDSGDADQRRAFSNLRTAIRIGRPLRQTDLRTLARVFTRIRNNLFHGRKIYDDTSDRRLLTLVTPIIAAIVQRFLPTD